MPFKVENESGQTITITPQGKPLGDESVVDLPPYLYKDAEGRQGETNPSIMLQPHSQHTFYYNYDDITLTRLAIDQETTATTTRYWLDLDQQTTQKIHNKTELVTITIPQLSQLPRSNEP